MTYNGYRTYDAWLSKSPDPTPLNFYLWEYIKKEILNHKDIENREQLIQAINDAFDELKRINKNSMN